MEIRPLSDGDLDACAALAARAFAGDPAFRHVVGERRSLLAPLFGAELRIDRAGGARMLGAFAPELTGLAVWFAPGYRAPSFVPWLLQLPRLWPLALSPGAAWRGHGLKERIEAERAEHRGASYLRLLAVAPEAQGKGVGVGLIGRVMQEAGAEVFLETSVESNVAFYERRGFKRLRRIEPAGMPPFWLMLRSRSP